MAEEGDVVELEMGTPSPEDQLGVGLTFESCTTDSDCAPPRYCRGYSSVGATSDYCEGLHMDCFCLAFLNEPCNSSATCPFGEGCVDASNFSICASCRVVIGQGMRFLDDARLCDEAEDTTIVDSSEDDEEDHDGDDDDEEGGEESNEQQVPLPPRSIAPVPSLEVPPNAPPDFPRESVTPEADPSAPADLPAPQSTTLPSATNTPSIEVEPDDPVCIAASALSHLPPSDLVFPVHRQATVLCDTHGSCATAGHMIDFHGSPMMMSTYCRRFASTPCTHRVMLVNSPRICTHNIRTRRLRIASKTPGLQFTALAARYASTFEEVLVSIVLHLGF